MKARDLIRVMPLTSRVVAKLSPDVLVMNVSCHYQPVFERCQGLATYRFYLQGNKNVYNHQTLPFLPILMELMMQLKITGSCAVSHGKPVFSKAGIIDV